MRLLLVCPKAQFLGPLIFPFLMFIDDLVKDMSVHVRLFADDCILYTKVTTMSDQSNLSANLRRVKEWCSKWQMSLNMGKTVCRSITDKLNPLVYPYSLDGVLLEKVDNDKYLGVTIYSNLRWNMHATNIVKNANTRLGFL